MTSLIIQSALLFLFYSTVRSEEFVASYTYSDLAAWDEIDACINGKRQSPVNIVMNDLVFSKQNGPIFYRENTNSVPVALYMHNTGYAIKINATWTHPSLVPTIIGNHPLLNGAYQFEHFYIHWGLANNNGSEHTIDMMSYPAESRITYKNKKYETVDIAMLNPDGLLSLNYFYKIDPENNYNGLKLFAPGLPNITEPGSYVFLPPIPLTNLTPECGDYYVLYEGSITTPPCYECVTWIMCINNKIPTTDEDIDLLRTVTFWDGSRQNIRPLKELFNRQLQFVYY